MWLNTYNPMSASKLTKLASSYIQALKEILVPALNEHFQQLWEMEIQFYVH